MTGRAMRLLGSRLCAALKAHGDRMRVLDDLSTGPEPDLAPSAELPRGDVADPAAPRGAMAGADGCFHLATAASVERGAREWPGYGPDSPLDRLAGRRPASHSAAGMPSFCRRSSAISALRLATSARSTASSSPTGSQGRSPRP